MGPSSSGGVVSTVPEGLQALADAYGVATEYWDQAGERVEVSVETVVAVLTALGLDVRNEVAIGADRKSTRLNSSH